MAMLLGERSKTRHQITKAVLLAAAGYSCKEQRLLHLLLVDHVEEFGFPDRIFSSMLLEVAVQNIPHGVHVVALLLDLDASEAHITDTVIIRVMEDWNLKLQLISLLCRRSSKAGISNFQS